MRLHNCYHVNVAFIPQASPQEKETESEADVQNSSTCSEWFNTTRDEMILFEKFGEDYDEVVNKV